MFIDKIRKTIIEHNMIEYDDKVVCAVSGGADSVCLFYSLLEIRDEFNIKIYAANVNHMIRGNESDEDSKFVKDLCKKEHIELFYKEFDVPKIAKEQKLGEEECGRKLRYMFFDEISKQLGGAKTATAHNLNDNAETILFRLIRGSSSDGICGIKYKRENIIRPLLDVERTEIESFLVDNNIKWRNDSTNYMDAYSRNRIRINVMPQLNMICSEAQKKIIDTAMLVSEDNEYLNQCAKYKLNNCYKGDLLYTDKFNNLPNPIRRRIAAFVLKKWGVKEITGKKISDFLTFSCKGSGFFFDINSEYLAEKSYDKIFPIKRESTDFFNAEIAVGENCETDFWKIIIKCVDKSVKKRDNNIAVFDADKLNGKFKIRYKRDGDRIFQKGLNGSKKVSDIFTDNKIDSRKRKIIPIIEYCGEVIFVCGQRQSEEYSVNKNTKKFIIIEYIEKE